MNSFFKSTPLYKEYLLLSTITTNTKITQRKIASLIDVSLAMVNYYLDEYEAKGLIERSYSSKKDVLYTVTKKGEERKKYLNMQYLEAALAVFNEAKKECFMLLENVITKGYKTVLFYGAGEVAEMLLTAIKNENTDISVCAIIDDDVNKIGNTLLGVPIISIDDVTKYDYEVILISSYTNCIEINQKLMERGFEKERIIKFFEVDLI